MRWQGSRCDKVQTYELEDDSGKIRAVSFGETAARLDELLAEGSVYVISRGRLKNVDKAFRPKKGPTFELLLDETTVVTPVAAVPVAAPQSGAAASESPAAKRARTSLAPADATPAPSAGASAPAAASDAAAAGASAAAAGASAAAAAVSSPHHGGRQPWAGPDKSKSALEQQTDDILDLILLALVSGKGARLEAGPPGEWPRRLEGVEDAGGEEGGGDWDEEEDEEEDDGPAYVPPAVAPPPWFGRPADAVARDLLARRFSLFFFHFPSSHLTFPLASRQGFLLILLFSTYKQDAAHRPLHRQRCVQALAATCKRMNDFLSARHGVFYALLDQLRAWPRLRTPRALKARDLTMCLQQRDEVTKMLGDGHALIALNQ